jgi:SAM-dependent methyltransferase
LGKTLSSKNSRVYRVLRKFAKKENLVLDAGCGTGEIGEFAQNLGCHVVSLDISKSYLYRVSKHVENRICASLSYLPFKAGSFDVVLSTDVVEHLPDFGLAIDDLFRVSSHLVIVTTPCNGITRKLYGAFFPESLVSLDRKVGHLHIWSLRGLEQKLTKVNWSLSSISVHVVQPISNRFFSRRFVELIRLIENMGDRLLPSAGTISLVIAVNDTVNLFRRNLLSNAKQE